MTGPRPLNKKAHLTKVAHAFAERLFGIPLSLALADMVCIECRGFVDVELLTDQEKAEYEISGLCQPCQERLFRESK